MFVPAPPPPVFLDCCGAVPGVEDTYSTNYGGIATHRNDVNHARSTSAYSNAPDDAIETGMLHVAGYVRLRKVKDGLSKTLMVGELVYNENDPYTQLFGALYYANPWVAENVLTTGFGINDEYTYKKSSVRSEHRGGAQFTFADGHVRFMRDDVPQNELAAMTTREGADAISYYE